MRHRPAHHQHYLRHSPIHCHYHLCHLTHLNYDHPFIVSTSSRKVSSAHTMLPSSDHLWCFMSAKSIIALKRGFSHPCDSLVLVSACMVAVTVVGLGPCFSSHVCIGKCHTSEYSFLNIFFQTVHTYALLKV